VSHTVSPYKYIKTLENSFIGRELLSRCLYWWFHKNVLYLFSSLKF